MQPAKTSVSPLSSPMGTFRGEQTASSLLFFFFSFSRYYTQNLSTLAAKPLAARNEGVSPRRKNKTFLVSSRLDPYIITSWFAIAPDEIKNQTDFLIREKADCKQASAEEHLRTDDVNSVRNPVRRADWSTEQLHCFSYCLRMTDKRQKATKVKCKREESPTKQSIFVSYSLLCKKHLSFAGARWQMNTTLYQNRPEDT